VPEAGVGGGGGAGGGCTLSYNPCQLFQNQAQACLDHTPSMPLLLPDTSSGNPADHTSCVHGSRRWDVPHFLA